jgi:hypothetical protein
LQAVAGGHQPFVCIHPTAGHTTDQVAQVCELLLEQNFQLALGSFERDHVDGEIRFRIALPYCNSYITSEQVIWCLEIGVASTEVGMQKIETVLHNKSRQRRMEV